MEPFRQHVLMLLGAREARFRERQLPVPGPGDVIVRPTLSAFKHGTEMMAWSGRSPFARRSFDKTLRIFQDRPGAGDFYPRPMGSMMVGEVEWVGPAVSSLTVGQDVYGWAPVADMHLMPATSLLPLGELSPEAALCIDPASFALGAVTDGAIAAGETVLVTGLGAIGLLAIQYCLALGAQVVAASAFEMRRELAARFGASHVIDTAAVADLGRAVKERTGGVDAAIECSGNVATLHQTIRATRQCGRVVCVGFYGPADSGLHLGEEFFHNRISLLASLPALAWENPTRGEPPLYARDLQCRAAADFAAQRITPAGLIDPVLPFAEAERAVTIIAEAPEAVLKAALRH